MTGLLTPNEFAGDDGQADPALSAALSAVAGAADPSERMARLERVVEALSASRLIVPVVAVLGESGESSLTGLASDKSADMALVTLTAPDGRKVLPVFSGAGALAAWDDRARPVPVSTRRAALAAVEEGCELFVVDPASTAVVVPRPAVWCLAQGETWVPSPRHPEVAGAVEHAVAGEPSVTSARSEPGGGPGGRGAELVVVLTVRPGLDRPALDLLTARVSAALGASDAVAALVDSVRLRLESA